MCPLHEPRYLTGVFAHSSILLEMWTTSRPAGGAVLEFVYGRLPLQHCRLLSKSLVFITAGCIRG